MPIRRSYYQPHLSAPDAESGLRNGTLIKGILRVNQRNFEEAYIDNPDGTDQQDIVLLGLKARNRAMHSDLVVCRLRERDNWVVCEALYEAWREGKLGLDRDEDGRPISIPPVKRVEEETSAGRCPPAPTPLMAAKNALYSRNMLLRISDEVASSDGGGESRTGEADEVEKKLDELSISVNQPFGRAAEPQRKGESRSNYRLLCEMLAEDWGIPDACLQKTATVVHILEARNSRRAVGQLKPMTDGNTKWALFSPTDSRMPRMMVPASEVPTDFFARPQDFSQFIYVAAVAEWPDTAQFARGQLYKLLGDAGDIEAETEGLLLANKVDTRAFSDIVLSSLPVTDAAGDWQIDKKEYSYRRDYRGEIVFTIDPETARDLDDALHIKHIGDCDGKGTPGFEVGVHIADVTHFLRENTQLDKWAAERSTSVYLVDRVVPMLPLVLCEHLCSLNPGKDKLTFSVVWKMDGEGRILDEWFGRSVINSSCKLSYDHAEDILRNGREGSTSWGEMPTIFNSRSVDDVAQSVLSLNSLAVKMRARRFKQGALCLDQPKLKFKLAADTGLPYGVALDERGEANYLVEEFMLLANMAVANKIYSAFPHTALLRRHPPPKEKILVELREKSARLNYPLHVDSSGALSKGLQAYASRPELKYTVMPYLHQLVMRTMRLAEYFCPGYERGELERNTDGDDDDQGEEKFRHYALSCDRYTHFTSPIRRYPDVLVHRFLAAALGYQGAPQLTPPQVAKIADRCNEAKLAAQVVSDGSAELFFLQLVKAAGKLKAKAVVTAIYDSSFDVLLVDYGLIRRVYLDKLPSLLDAHQLRKGKVFNKLVLRFPTTSETIEVLSPVTVILTAKGSAVNIKQTATILLTSAK